MRIPKICSANWESNVETNIYKAICKRLEKMQKKSRLEIIKRMKRVIGTRNHKELAIDLGINKQLITNYIVRGDSAFYHRIFEFGKKHNLSYDWLFHEKVLTK